MKDRITDTENKYEPITMVFTFNRGPLHGQGGNMAGTTLANLKLIKVIDGDTIRVEIDGKSESIRIACLDTEESQAGGGKPVTQAGVMATRWAKEYFGADDAGAPRGDVRIDVEFDTNDPVPTCMRKHRDNYGRLL
ncbi:MAG: nuclease (SNase domain-containing protein), partial [Halothiobacillaceae bacterium]